MSLRKTEKDLVEALKEHLGVIATGAPAAEIGADYDGAEECFHAVACCKLLASADRLAFQRYLFWAGLTRRYFLSRCQAEGVAGNFRCARSRSDGFFCALAAGDVALAAEIGGLSPPNPIKTGEYEEDFVYQLLLHRHLAGAPAAQRNADLRALEQASGGPSPRIDACRALEVRDAGAFEAALTALADAYTASREEIREQSADVPSFEPLSRIYTEGLALIRIAEHGGLKISLRNFPLCPRSARVKVLVRRPDDLFAEMSGI